MEGTDGNGYYWHDKRIQRKVSSRRRSCSGSVIVWGCFSRLCTSSICLFKWYIEFKLLVLICSMFHDTGCLFKTRYAAARFYIYAWWCICSHRQHLQIVSSRSWYKYNELAGLFCGLETHRKPIGYHWGHGLLKLKTVHLSIWPVAGNN